MNGASARLRFGETFSLACDFAAAQAMPFSEDQTVRDR
jgi:hypothetical protein